MFTSLKIIILLLASFNHFMHCAQQRVSDFKLSRTLNYTCFPNCCPYPLEKVFYENNFTLEELQDILTNNPCKLCRQRAFTYLIIFVEHLGDEKSKAVAELFIKNGINVNDSNDHDHLPIFNAVANRLIKKDKNFEFDSILG